MVALAHPETEELLSMAEHNYRVLDRIEAEVFVKCPPMEADTKHFFFKNSEGKPAMYVRATRLPADMILTTVIHNVLHPYVVMSGAGYVWTQEEGWTFIRAPFTGITKPGTKRLIRTVEEMIWVTFHATDKTDVDEIAREITLDRPNELLNENDRSRLVNLAKGEYYP